MRQVLFYSFYREKNKTHSGNHKITRAVRAEVISNTGLWLHIPSSSASCSLGSSNPAFHTKGQKVSSCSLLTDLMSADTPLTMEGCCIRSSPPYCWWLVSRQFCATKVQTWWSDSHCFPDLALICIFNCIFHFFSSHFPDHPIHSDWLLALFPYTEHYLLSKGQLWVPSVHREPSLLWLWCHAGSSLSLITSNLLSDLFCFIYDKELEDLIPPSVNDKNPLHVYLLGPWIKSWQVSNIPLPLCILIHVSN